MVEDLIENLFEDIDDIVSKIERIGDVSLCDLKDELLEGRFSLKRQILNLKKDILKIQKEIMKGE